MKITKLILENFSNVDTAMNAKRIEIDFSKVKNKIILLIGPNGSGKTSLLSLFLEINKKHTKLSLLLLHQ